jgi:hypothetical protein
MYNTFNKLSLFRGRGAPTGRREAIQQNGLTIQKIGLLV